jgi:hypothetical protein
MRALNKLSYPESVSDSFGHRHAKESRKFARRWHDQFRVIRDDFGAPAQYDLLNYVLSKHYP